MLYLFPFGRVRFGSSIALYGSGEICEQYLSQLRASKFCHVVCILDKKIERTSINNNIVYSPVEKIRDYNFDYIVIASNKYNDEIYQSLISIGYRDDDIVEFSKDEIISFKEVNKTPKNFDWDNYYNDAEHASNVQIEKYIQPVLDKYKSNISFEKVVDFACGKGRIAEYFIGFSDLLYCVDINPESIKYCEKRFKDKRNVSCIVSDESGFNIKDDSISFIFSWDAMVHFDYRSIDIAFGEFYRVLLHGGYALIHHSNLAENKDFIASDNWIENPHCRSNIGMNDIERLAKKHGFSIVEQSTIDWEFSNLDGVTLLKK